MKNKAIIIGLILVIITLSLSGCQDLFGGNGTTTYESHPTKVRYTLSYGYLINCTGTGKYKINYKCDIPDEFFNTQIISTIFHYNDYEDRILATHNSMKIWDITSTLTKNYDLGVTTTVQGDSYIVSDLNGANALSIQEISDNYPELVKQYTHAQSNDSTFYIDPFDPEISAMSQVLEMFNKIEHGERKRIVEWITHRFQLGEEKQTDEIKLSFHQVKLSINDNGHS